LVGLTIGIVLAPMTTRLFRSLLFEVSPTQPLVFVAVALGLAFAVIVAAYLPARSASLNHPAVVLKQSDH